MTIPSKEDFVEALAIGQQLGAAHLRPSFTFDVFAGDDVQIGKRLVRDAILSVRRQDELFLKHPAVNWMTSQPGFRAIERKIRPKHYRSADSDSEPHCDDLDTVVDAHHDMICRAAKSAPPRYRQRKFSAAIDKTLAASDTFENWLLGLVSAVHEYHYLDTTEVIIRNRRQLKDRTAVAIAGLHALRELQEDRAAVNRFNLLQKARGCELSMFDTDSECLLQLLHNLAQSDQDSMYLLSRLDGTARERLFVFRVGRLNDRHWGKYRASLIASLMTIEGFSTQLDERTIERQCSAIQGKERQLLDELRVLTATS
ncbi:hypothetical protein KPB05_23050 [Burkholderia gladioli]|uniref:hypothetical protein n=1 Tax=Burkholderia gladioli TaxID=28095 RepID=UPI002867A7FF|nr:hypothetical protein [Burkholderia gladioli]MDR8090340.1 hypothetical protein [Burkholderia gladioli]